MKGAKEKQVQTIPEIRKGFFSLKSSISFFKGWNIIYI